MGYLVLNALAKMYDCRFKEEKQFDAYVGKTKINGTIVHLLLPTTYMNLSGHSVKLYMSFFKLVPANIIVVADDVSLPYGEMRIRRMGSAGGHNGLKSIEACLGTREYNRLRMGIGRNVKEKTLADYVLDNFSNEEMLTLGDFVQEGAIVINRLMNESISHVMNSVNVKIKNTIRPQVEGQENIHE